MAVTAYWYGLALYDALKGDLDVDGTLKCGLATSSYTPAQDTHTAWADITNEVVGTGYTAGGATLANVAITYTAGTNVIKLDADDVTWSTATITARYAIIYDSTKDSLIGYIDFGGDVTSTGGDFTITFHANGIATATVS